MDPVRYTKFRTIPDPTATSTFALSRDLRGRVGTTAVPKSTAMSAQIRFTAGLRKQALVRPDFRVSDTIFAGTPPQRSSAPPCAPIQSESPWPQLASACVRFAP